MRNPEHLHITGKSQPMTIITAVKPFRVWRLRIILWIVQTFKVGLGRVVRLRFIHFAQWTILRPEIFARSAPSQSTDKLDRNYFMFSTNYNGPWDQYIDSFSLVKGVRHGIELLWGTSAQFPHAFPVRPFKRYIRYHEYPVDAYYNAYPGATIRDIESALRVEQLAIDLAVSFRRAFESTIPVDPDRLDPLPPISPMPLAALSLIPMPLPSSFDDLDSSDITLPPEFQNALLMFIEKSAPHLGSTMTTRAPTRKSGIAPQGLQL